MKDLGQTTRRVVLVTGPAGAGRSSALKVFEDIGFEVIDNIPLRLVPALLEDNERGKSLALGVDPRTRDYSYGGVIDAIELLKTTYDINLEVLYVDCARDVLLRRFSETRRRHPLAGGDRPQDGILQEFELLEPVKRMADILIDTSELNIHQLRAEVERWFLVEQEQRMTVSVQSFSYKRGLPRGADMVFDCRFLNNPHWDPQLREATGLDQPVADYIRKDPRYEIFKQKVQDIVLWLLPAYLDEGKSHLSIAFGCTGGQHRSVMLAETLGQILADDKWQVSIQHRELNRQK